MGEWNRGICCSNRLKLFFVSESIIFISIGAVLFSGLKTTIRIGI